MNKFRYNVRIKNTCIFCNGNLNILFSIPNMPMFMGSINNLDNTLLYSDMTYTICSKCNCVQIKELIDSNILYQNNHNLDTVGELWQSHFIEFSNFVKNGIINKRVLEIADPSCKIARYVSEYSKIWEIVEYNPNFDSTSKNVKFIETWFDSDFNQGIYDVIIHSHFFEHLFNPLNDLKKMNECLNIGGEMYFSVPNLEYIVENKFTPANALHFEHTFFYKKNDLKSLLNLFGFEVNVIFEYRNHSIFFKCTKISNKIQSYDKFKFLDSSDNFILNYDISKDIINKFNSIKNKNKFIFGCHISTQYLISIGVDINNIVYFLDNSKNKQNNFLYGYDVLVKSPNIISDYENPVVLVTHTSVYKNEISEQLKKINKNVILI